MTKIKESFKLIWSGFWTEMMFKKIRIPKVSFYSIAFMSTVFHWILKFSCICLLALHIFFWTIKSCLHYYILSKNLSICNEVRKYVHLCYITVSSFLSHQVPKTERKKRRKKETDLVSYNLFLMLARSNF